MQAAKSKYGVGASLLRREDDRYLRPQSDAGYCHLADVIDLSPLD